MQTDLFPLTTEYKEVSVNDFPEFPGVNPTPQMVTSVKRFGVLEPILLRGNTLVAGRRRLKAARVAGLKTIPARLFPEDFSNEYILSLIENEQRRVNPLSDLHAVESLLDLGKEEKEISVETGISLQRLKKILSLRNLIPPLRKAFDDGIIKYSVAHIASKKSKKLQNQLASLLEQDGVLRLKDLQEIIKVERKSKIASLPDSLFNSVSPDWKTQTLQKLEEARRQAEIDADSNWLDKLDRIIGELKDV